MLVYTRHVHSIPLLCVHRRSIRRVRLVARLYVVCILYVDSFLFTLCSPLYVRPFESAGGWRRDTDVASCGWSLTQVYG